MPDLSQFRISISCSVWICLAIFSLSKSDSATFAQQVPVRKYMVATVNDSATEAGLAALRAGGNAVDAAVTAAFTLGVVDGFNSGIGGGCFILIRTADGEIIAMDAREMAPGTATRDMYFRDGQVRPDLAQTGPLAVATPGALAGYAEAVEKYGRLGLPRALQAGIEQAEQGFIVDEHYANRIRSEQKEIVRFEGSRAILLHSDGKPWVAGERLVQSDLARTYRSIAREGTSWFYQGEFAQTVGQWMTKEGGILRADDFARYQLAYRQPLITKFRDCQIVGFPPPSSGGVHVAQVLNILENFDLKSIQEKNPATAAHLVAEAMKLAFADRAFWLGDPDFVKVPKGIADATYARALSTKIDLDRAAHVAGPGQPPDGEANIFEKLKHTTHIAAADAEGNWVAITTTVNTTFGSKVIVPGTGVILNNQMDDFAIAPGQPNSFGLVGGEANAVGPGKRPLSSMSPTIVMRDDQPIMTVGAAGGPRIISATLQTILRHIEYQWPIDQAMAAPRIHHQWVPAELLLEEGMDPAVSADLARRGHSIRIARSGSMAVVQAIGFDPQTRTFAGAADPRANGTAKGDIP